MLVTLKGVLILVRLAYKMTHMYYNWPGTIRVPAPCQVCIGGVVAFRNTLQHLTHTHTCGHYVDMNICSKIVLFQCLEYASLDLKKERLVFANGFSLIALL